MEKLKMAIVGLGTSASQCHLPNLLKRSDVEIVALADISEERRSSIPTLLPEARLYTDYESLLASEAGLDLLDIATPPYVTAEIARSALRQGIHVLCETPVGLSMNSTKTLLDDARQADRLVFPCTTLRFAPILQMATSIIESGILGRIRSVTVQSFLGSLPRGIADWRPDWRRENRFSGGGVTLSMASEILPVIFDWLGDSPLSATAKMTRNDNDHDTENTCSAVLTYPQGTASIHMSWTAGLSKFLATLHGEKGALVIDDDRLEISRRESNAGPSSAGHREGTPPANSLERREIPSQWVDPTRATWFAPLLDSFLKTLRGNRSHAALLESHHALIVIDALYRSAASQSRETPMTWDPV
ncbi:MAG: Gfo/Idh/MocA family oxidoreductase [Deltaproteobacteria bacterium]|nr:Gfo/Idh/MocA family oxidoreductase [Deltaproteobacteria bacterium]MBI3295412.1 Gfo/Idh/MocA family oxidoreductase [Deltaproteobacteria bacterium]